MSSHRSHYTTHRYSDNSRSPRDPGYRTHAGYPAPYQSYPLERSSTAGSSFGPPTPQSIGSPIYSLEGYAGGYPSPQDPRSPCNFSSGFEETGFGGGEYGDYSHHSTVASPTDYPANNQFEANIGRSGDGEIQSFICLVAGCTSTGFKRKADLERHYRNCHLPAEQKESYPCDYSRCSRRTEPFHRRDHFRDHLREYHKEDIEKRGAPTHSESFDDRNIAESWWRCSRCLRRISIRENGYDCPTCKSQCADRRQKVRRSGTGSSSSRR